MSNCIEENDRLSQLKNQFFAKIQTLINRHDTASDQEDIYELHEMEEFALEMKEDKIARQVSMVWKGNQTWEVVYVWLENLCQQANSYIDHPTEVKLQNLFTHLSSQ